MRSSSRRTTIIGLSVVAAILIAGGVAAALLLTQSRQTQVAAPSTSPTPSPMREPVPADVPTVALARATPSGWEVASRTSLAAVLPEVGDAAEGSSALRLDAPVVEPGVVAAATTAAVEPSTSYTFQIAMRSLEPFAKGVPIEVTVGGRAVAIGGVDAKWRTFGTDFTTEAEETSVRIEIRLQGAVSGVAVDDLRLAASGGGNLVPNGSFEDIGDTAGVLNDTLVFTPESAVLAVRFAPGSLRWTATPTSGGDVITGSAELTGGLDGAPLDSLPPGHYELAVEDPTGARTTTAIAIVDAPGLQVRADPRFGVGLHVEKDWYEGAGSLAAALGFAEARNDILWSLNEVARGVYEWDPRYATEFDRLHANGVKVLGIVNYSNKLYGVTRAPSTQDAIAAYGRYARAIADRFDLVGLEVFNEFNIARFNDSACGSSADCYLPLVQAVDAELGEEHADLPVVVGSTALYDRPWFQRLWQLGGLEYADAISFHPYEVTPFKPDELAGVVHAAREDMQAAGEERPVWITELGWTSKTGATSLVEQGEMLVRAEVSALSAGAEKYFWYDLVNDSANRDDHEGNFGLYEHLPRPGVVALAPKPAAFAQALLIAQLGGRPYTESQSDSDTRAYVFGTGSDATRVAWAPSGSGQVSFESDGEFIATSLNGLETSVEPVEGVVSIPLTNRPTFIRAAASPAEESASDPSASQ